MRKGKATQAVLSRSVLRVLKEKKEGVLRYPEYGCGYGAFRTQESEGRVTVTACGSTAGFPQEASAFAVAEAMNHLLAAGARPFGMTVQLLLPETYEEAKLKELVRALEKHAAAYGAVILGGHTEVLSGISRPEVFLTAIGHGDALVPEAQPEMDLAAVGTIASSAAAWMARNRKEELTSCFSEGFLMDTARMGEERFLPAAVQTVLEAGGGAMKAPVRGGVFAGLWEMAEHARIGLDIDLRKIPVRQETIEICEFFSLNPYQLFGTDLLLVAVPDGSALVRTLEQKGIPAAVIGRTTDGPERILRNGEEIRYLDKPQMDEWYHMEEREQKCRN